VCALNIHDIMFTYNFPVLWKEQLHFHFAIFAVANYIDLNLLYIVLSEIS